MLGAKRCRERNDTQWKGGHVGESSWVWRGVEESKGECLDTWGEVRYLYSVDFWPCKLRPRASASGFGLVLRLPRVQY